MISFRWYVLVGVALTASVSCSGDKSSEQILASVNNEVLYLNDVKNLFPGKGLKYEDSIAILKAHVKRWVTESILMEHGKKNMPDISESVNRKSEDYKRALYIYEYERYYVRQHLDTVVSLAEMQQYYKDNARDFALRDFIIKVMYVRFPDDTKDLAKVKGLMRSGKNEDLLKVEEMARAYAENYFDGHDSWIYMDDLLREVPAQIEDKTQFLKNNAFIEVHADGYSYYVLIFEYKLKDELSPFQLEKNNIRNRILHTRSAALVEKMRQDVIKKGYGQMDIKEYAGK